METDVFSSPHKRQKTQSPSSCKGKEKIEEEETKDESSVSDPKVCGICFEGKAIRGWIDSCDHHFCFVCIMEWSKVESRCPLCKQRFKIISRKPKDGVFREERVVNVPVRNQVWHPLGNQTTTEHSDPYAEVKCIKCQSSSDDHLLLLCDLCDSAAHTYCVHLGYTVPEGDWYCEDCTAVKNEYSDEDIVSDCQYSRNTLRTIEVETNSQDSITTTDNDTDYQEPSNSISVQRASTNVSISDIIRQAGPRNRSRRRTSRRQNDLSSRGPDRGVVSDSAGTDSSARTLGLCRNVRNRIQVLRDNWDAFRNGSLVFSNLSNSDMKNKRRRSREEINDRSRKSQPSSSLNCNQNTTKDNDSSVKVDNKGRYDVDKAWKMLDIAKSVEKSHNLTRSSHQISIHQPGERNGSKEANNTNTTFSMSRSRSVQPKDAGGVVTVKDYMHRPLEIMLESEKSEEKRSSKDSKDTLVTSYSPNVRPSQIYDFSSSKETCLANQRGHQGTQSSLHDSNHQAGKQDVLKAANNTSLADSISRSKNSQPDVLGKLERERDNRHRSFETEQQKLKSEKRRVRKDTLGTSSCSRPSEISLANPSHILNQGDLFERSKDNEKSDSLNFSRRGSNIWSASHTESMCRGSELLQNRLELCASSGLKEEQFKEGGTDRSYAKILLRKDNDAKCEVQSLVKLNLKLLNRDKQLGVNGFKEVARLATHTILAACGLEHKESSVCPFPNTICRHNDQTKQLHMSNLMPSSCRECFYGFVKDVVSSIMAQG